MNIEKFNKLLDEHVLENVTEWIESDEGFQITANAGNKDSLEVGVYLDLSMFGGELKTKYVELSKVVTDIADYHAEEDELEKFIELWAQLNKQVNDRIESLKKENNHE